MYTISVKEVQNHLMSYGIKPSVQRIAIMQYLMANKTHPSADEVYSALTDSLPTLSKTTVYNTLKLFHDSNAVQCLTIDEKNARFDAFTQKHMHFKCKCCGKIFDVKMPCLFNNLTDNEYGFDVNEVQIYQFGLCKQCKTIN